MDEVDGVLGRLATELETRDRLIAELEGRGDPPDPPASETRDDADAANEV